MASNQAKVDLGGNACQNIDRKLVSTIEKARQAEHIPKLNTFKIHENDMPNRFKLIPKLKAMETFKIGSPQKLDSQTGFA